MFKPFEDMAESYLPKWVLQTLVSLSGEKILNKICFNILPLYATLLFDIFPLRECHKNAHQCTADLLRHYIHLKWCLKIIPYTVSLSHDVSLYAQKWTHYNIFWLFIDFESLTPMAVLISCSLLRTHAYPVVASVIEY